MPHELIKQKIRTIPDFPKKGIMFRDVTTLLKDAEGFKLVIDAFTERYSKQKIDVVVGIESRGFIVGAPLAHRLGVGFVPARKAGKLPAEVEQVEYDLEYGKDKIEMHKDAIQKGANVLVVDDLIATAGTLGATINLINKLGGQIVECAVIIELPSLHGRKKIETQGHKLFSLVEFEGD
jgi:adenine phosphoribosyltransferase